MRKFITGAVVAALTTTGAGIGAGVASASPAAPVPAKAVTVVTAQDVYWLWANDQTDLAEITIGELAEARAVHASTRTLARMTLHDHEIVLADLEALARDLGVTLLNVPSAAQQAQAAQLAAVPRSGFDRLYDTDQVKGHLQSIGGTLTEISRGSDTAVRLFALAYLPVARKHLQMARSALAKL
jgi:putative membrane protein